MTIAAAIFFFLSIGFTLKTFDHMGTSVTNTGVVMSSICWTLTALFAGWLS